MDGAHVWDLYNMIAGSASIHKSWKASQVTHPSGAGNCGATTSLTWIRHEDEPDDGLIYGTANRFIVC